MKQHMGRPARALIVLLALSMILGAFVSCAKKSEIPDGYQYATCRGEYFRLFVPTQWTVSTESGVSGAYISLLTETSVSMDEVYVTRPADGNGEEKTATLEDFLNQHLSEVQKLRNFEEEKRFDTTLGGYKAKDITYKATKNGNSYRYRQVLTKVEGRFYLFTFTSTADTFERWLDTVDGILENIMFYSAPYEGNGDDRDIPDDVETPDGMRLISSNEVAYRFFAPTSWTVDAESKSNLVYFSEEDRSNVSMIAYLPESDTFSVANYWELCEKDYRENLRDFKLLSETESKMGGRKATVYEYTYTVGGQTYKCRQTASVYTTMIYIMTYTALPENYDAHLDDVNRMQEALRFRSKGLFKGNE